MALEDKVGTDVEWHGTVWQAWSGCSGRDCSGLTGSGWLRHGKAGEVRQGSEAKGNAGRVEVRQAAKGAIDQERRDGWS